MRITVAASAKINLWLRVGRREASGYHAIDTLFCALQLADSVEVRAITGPDPVLEIGYGSPLSEPPDLGPASENLAVRAGRAFLERAGTGGAVGIRLVKRIPVGAGLGGGSSDAAAVLRGLARLHPGAMGAEALVELGETLGSDVPFFVRGAPLAHGTGRGERLGLVPPLPARPVVVAIPRFGVSTADAYDWLDADRATTPDVPAQPDALRGLDWDAVVDAARNDFEEPVFRRYPLLATLKSRLQEEGARPALLAGSGSTVFGVFHRAGEAQGAAKALAATEPSVRVLVTRTRTR